jgi:hypothetical protein
VHHLALVVGVFDGDVVVPGEVLAVGAEEAVGDVAEDDVGPVPRPDGLPHDGGLLVVFVQALDDDLPKVAERGRLVRGGEVAAVGGAVEEDAGAAVVVDPVHPPRRVQRRALRAQGHAHPVLVRVEVHAAHAVPQADVHAVGELLHRGRALVGGRAATAGESVASRCGLGGRKGEKRSRAEQVFAAEAGDFKAQVSASLPSDGIRGSVAAHATCQLDSGIVAGWTQQNRPWVRCDGNTATGQAERQTADRQRISRRVPFFSPTTRLVP